MIPRAAFSQISRCCVLVNLIALLAKFTTAELSDSLREITYQSYENNTNQPVCTMEKPNLVFRGVRSRIKCSIICEGDVRCIGVNWKDPNNCELFFVYPTSFGTTKDCTYFSPNANECVSNPCQHGGTCTDLVNGYSCLCSPYWNGTNCETCGNPPSTNYALLRPANQSSTQTFAASLAVDGNPNPNLATGRSCSQAGPTTTDPGQWLMVDLGWLVYINKVVLTNRADCCANRLDFFIVGVTNTSSTVAAPVRDNYKLCGKYPSTAAAGATIPLTCFPKTPPAQYVIIQQPLGGPGYLTICELEVYGCGVISL